MLLGFLSQFLPQNWRRAIHRFAPFIANVASNPIRRDQTPSTFSHRSFNDKPYNAYTQAYTVAGAAPPDAHVDPQGVMYSLMPTAHSETVPLSDPTPNWSTLFISSARRPQYAESRRLQDTLGDISPSLHVDSLAQMNSMITNALTESSSSTHRPTESMLRETFTAPLHGASNSISISGTAKNVLTQAARSGTLQVGEHSLTVSQMSEYDYLTNANVPTVGAERVETMAMLKPDTYVRPEMRRTGFDAVRDAMKTNGTLGQMPLTASIEAENRMQFN